VPVIAARPMAWAVAAVISSAVEAGPRPEAAAPAAAVEISEAELDEPAVDVKAGGKEQIGTSRRRPVTGPGSPGGARRGAR